MRVALKRNVSITIQYATDLYGVDSIYVREINGYKSFLRFRGREVDNFNEALKTELQKNTISSYVVDSMSVVKDVLYINNVAIVELNYAGVSEIDFALNETVGYHINISKDNISFGWSWSLGKHIQNLSGRIEDVEIVGKDYETTLKKLMNKYSKKLERNCMYVFEVIAFRGKNKDIFRNNNRLIARESVGYQADNFDEEIWHKLHER